MMQVKLIGVGIALLLVAGCYGSDDKNGGGGGSTHDGTSATSPRPGSNGTGQHSGGGGGGIHPGNRSKGVGTMRGQGPGRTDSHTPAPMQDPVIP
jgi:hypothetical protein